jgi:arylsulfatase A-like enzyme
VWSGDHWLGELLAELAALDLLDETIVAFTSDHGEELFERGFIGHGQSLHGELVHVPLVLAGPGVPEARRNTSVVSSRLVAPLLAGLSGVELAGTKEALAALERDQRSEEFVVFATAKGSWKGRNNVRIVGMTDGEWKLDLALTGAPWGSKEPPPEGDWELFDPRQDPGEARDLSTDHPEVVARLRARLEAHWKELEARRIGRDIPAGGTTQLMLDALGYGGER